MYCRCAHTLYNVNHLNILYQIHYCIGNRSSDVVMLYEVRDGPCNESFGIHVATTARFPTEVIMEAKRKAEQLEQFVEDKTISDATGDCLFEDHFSMWLLVISSAPRLIV